MKYIVVAAILLAAVGAQKYCDKKQNGAVLEVTMRPPEKIEVQLGDEVSIACAGHGHGMADPAVYWMKGFGPEYSQEGTHMGVVATNKAVLYIAEVTEDHIDTYKCILFDCCSNTIEEIPVEIVVPAETCQDVYGIGHVVYGMEWKFTNWSTAIANCEAQGMEVAFPHNAEENAQLLQDVQTSFENHPNARKFAHENWIWLGANDAGEESSWVETITGNPVEWFNWASKQPDNWLKYSDDGQDCMGMSRETGEWDDSYNFYLRPYACICP